MRKKKSSIQTIKCFWDRLFLEGLNQKDKRNFNVVTITITFWYSAERMNGLIRDNYLKSSTEGMELKIVAFKQLFPRAFSYL